MLGRNLINVIYRNSSFSFCTYFCCILRHHESQSFLKDDHLFFSTVKDCMNELLLNEYDVADTLPISAGTAKRWYEGKSAPIYLMRKPVYKFFLRKLQANPTT